MTPSVRLGQARCSIGTWRSSEGRANRRGVSATRRRQGRTCALDPGRVRIGIAIDDELGLFAHPRGTLDGRDWPAVVAALTMLADEANVTRFIVGLPLDMRGGEGSAARSARALAQQLADATGREVELWDERLSTIQAARTLAANNLRGKKSRQHVDEAAACAILQSWLDARRERRRKR
jgi:putative Holliday junction resolvase